MDREIIKLVDYVNLGLILGDSNEAFANSDSKSIIDFLNRLSDHLSKVGLARDSSKVRDFASELAIHSKSDPNLMPTGNQYRRLIDLVRKIG